MEVAINAHREGNLEEARLLYKSIITEDPSCAHAHHNLSIITAAEDDISSTLSLLEQARSIDPTVLQFWLSAINIYISLAEWEKLLQCFKDYTKHFEEKTVADQLFAVDIFKNLISEICEAERTWFLDILATYFSAEEVKVRLKGLVSSAENNPVYKEALSSFEKRSESITKRNLSTGAKIVLIENKKYDEAIKKIKATFDTIFYDRLFLFEQLATAQISGRYCRGRATIDEAFAKVLGRRCF